MGVFKSLGLSPAKKAGAKAFRRLFGRVLPAGESDSATGSAVTSENGKNHDETSSSQKDLSKANTRDNNPQSNRDNPSTPRSSTEPRDSSTTRNDQHLTTTKAAPSTEAMASPQKQAAERNKENQPPDTSTLTDSLARLSLDRDNVTATPPTKPAAPTAPIFTDPAVVAERAMHMKFIEEALDMVCCYAQVSAA
jgi:hypothetical protein